MSRLSRLGMTGDPNDANGIVPSRELDMVDPYRILGVSRTADADTIRASFRRLARKYHPDVSTEPNAEDRFKEISEAYATLTDPVRKRQVDRRSVGAPTSARDRSGSSPDLHDLFHDLFGGKKKGGTAQAGAHRRAKLNLEFLDAVLGTKVRLTLDNGDGRKEHLQIKVPSGASNGDTLRIRGRGHPPRGGGPCGDLLVALEVSPHPLLKRSGHDLDLVFPMTVLEALEGGTFDVPTPSGTVQANIPAGARSGQRVRLKGRGVTKGNHTGDLFLIVRIETPVTTPESIEAARTLQQHYVDIRGDWTL